MSSTTADPVDVQNPLTLGLRGVAGTGAPRLADAVAKHNQMLIDAYHPENDRQAWLLGQAADAAARLDHCQFMIRALLDDQADRADLCWDEDRSRAVEEIAARLPKDPSRTASRLRETAQGCRWLLARWHALSIPLAENQGWDEAQCNLAATLMGVGPDLRPAYPDLAIGSDPATLAALMGERVDALRTLMTESLEPLDAKERELTRMGYPLHPSKEFLRLQRLENRLRRTLNESLNEFRRLRDLGFQATEPITLNVPPPRAESRIITALAPEPEPEPEPVDDLEPDWEPMPTPSPEFLADKPVFSMLVDMVGAIHARSNPAASSLSSALPTPKAPSNRKARRAREKAARKARTHSR